MCCCNSREGDIENTYSHISFLYNHLDIKYKSLDMTRLNHIKEPKTQGGAETGLKRPFSKLSEMSHKNGNGTFILYFI